MSLFRRGNLAEFLQEKSSNAFARVSPWLSGLAMRSPRSNQHAVHLDRLPIHLGIRSRVFLPK